MIARRLEKLHKTLIENLVVATWDEADRLIKTGLLTALDSDGHSVMHAPYAETECTICLGAHVLVGPVPRAEANATFSNGGRVGKLTFAAPPQTSGDTLLGLIELQAILGERRIVISSKELLSIGLTLEERGWRVARMPR